MGQELKQIFDENYSSLCNYAYAFLRDRHRAEDVVQSVFVQLWKNEKLSELEDPAPYLLRCVKYKCLDFLKSSFRNKEIYTGELPDIHMLVVDAPLEEEEVLPLLHYYVDQLPQKMRRVFLMSRLQEKSYREIASELDVSVKTVENQMGSALKKLRVLLKAHKLLALLAVLVH